MGLGARFVSPQFLASEPVPSLFPLSQKGRSEYAGSSNQSLVGQCKYPLASRISAEFSYSDQPVFARLGWTGGWLAIGAGWLESFRTSDYLGIILFFIKEMDPTCMHMVKLST